MLTKTGLKLGIALPQGFPDGVADPDLIVRFAQRAEALGYDDVWVIESVLGRFPIVEAVSTLTYVAAVTSRIRLGSSVLVTPLRNPVQLAKSLSSLDHLSGGRLTVGVGLGTTTGPYPAFGIDPEHRVTRFVEGLNVMKALWTQPAASFDGRFYKLNGVAMEPKPVQKPHPPIWLGARVEAAMRRAARLADGWMGAGSTPVDEFFDQLAAMRAILAQEGRDEANFGFSKRVYLAVDADVERGRKRIAGWIGAYYGNPSLADAWAITGSAQGIIDQLSRFREAGLKHMLLHPVSANLEELDQIAEDIAPHL